MSKTFIYILFLYFIVSQLCISQEVKIVKIHDTNLFELVDGTLISLAGLEIPPLNCEYPPFQLIANDSKEFAETYLLNRNLEIILIDSFLINDSQKVFLSELIKKYPFEDKNLNLEYLTNGLAKFTDNENLQNKEAYIKAEDKAKNNEIGIWKYFDKDSICKNSLAIFCKDTSLYSSFLYQTEMEKEISIGDIIGASAAGIGCGLPCALVTGIIFHSFSNSNSDELSWIFIGLTSGYAIGNAFGVYLVTRSWSDNISFPLMLISSSVGSGIWWLVATQIEYYPIISFLTLIIPSILNIGYAYFTYEISDYENDIRSNEIGINHQQIYNQDMIFKIPVFQINF